MSKSFFGLKMLALCALAALVGTTFAQDEISVTVTDQVSTEHHVMIDQVVMDMPGWVVIHAQSAEGMVGAVIGFRAVNTGTSENVMVPIDLKTTTPTLYAMLHMDSGEVGVYEFGTVEGADAPVAGEQTMVNPSFNIDLVHAHDMFVGDDNMFKIPYVIAQKDGFLVVHSGDRSAPGPVLGFAPVTAGVNTDVMVTLEGDVTPFVWPMLHVDDGTIGEYNFGTVEGEDGPVVVDGVVAMAPIVVNGPSMRANSQPVTDKIIIEGVSSDGPGFVVIHANNEGAPGEVIGFAPVVASTNVNVEVMVDAEKLTPIVFPMLHSDTGVVGTYEFGEVEGEDLPQMSDGKPLFFPILVMPGIMYTGGLDGDTLVVNEALMDTQGFLVIHADNAGAPGAVLGFTPLVKGLNRGIHIELATEGRTETVFPMLHVDTGVMGTYEFGEVEGEDLPVVVGEGAVFGAFTPGMMEGMNH